MTGRRKSLYLAFAVYFCCLLGFAVLPPFVRIWNRIDPHILGLPFAQFTVIGIAILMNLGLLAWFLIEGSLNRRERRADTRHGN